MRLHAVLSISPQSAHLPDTSNRFKNSALLVMLMCCSQMAAAQDRIYWDGGNTTQNGAVDGGAGTWDDASTNWTSQTGDVNYAADGLGALPDRRFTGTGGTVNVTATTPQAGRMQFSSSGYRLQGAAVDVQGRLVLSTGTTTTIANALAADGLESASTGALVIDATGTLQIDMGESVAGIVGNITNNGTLVFNRSDDLMLSNPISGSGLIRHQGTGVLTLDGTGVDYDGNVEVINGIFRPFQVEILGVVTLDGGTLAGLQPTDPPAEIALGAGGGTLDVTYPTFGTGNNISGIGKLTKTGTGELRLKGDRTFSGGMDINQGRVVFVDSPSAVTSPFGSGLLTVAAGARLDLLDTMSVPNAVSLVETSVLRIATAVPITLSGNIDFGGGSESLTLLGGTTTDQTVNFSGILSDGGFVVDATAISSARTLEFSGADANTYTGLTRLQTVADAGIRFRLNKTANVVAVPGDLTIDAGTEVVVTANEQIADTSSVAMVSGASLTLGDGAAVIETIADLSGTGLISLTDNSALLVTSGTFGGVISGDGSLTTQGNGTLVLTSDNNYTTTTIGSDSTLRIGDGGTSGSLSGDIDNNGVLVFDRSDNFDIGSEFSGEGIIRQAGEGDLRLSPEASDPEYTYNGNVEVTNGRFSPGLVTVGGVVELDGGTLFGVIEGSEPEQIELKENGGVIDTEPGAFALPGDISGTGKLTKTGTASLSMLGEKTFSGGLDINQGNVVIQATGSHNSPLGTGAVTLAAGTGLTLGSVATLPNDISLTDTSELRVRTGFEIGLSGNMNLGGMSEILTLFQSVPDGTADQSLVFSGSLSNGGFIVDAGTITTRTPIIEFSGAAANTYTGLTRIQTAANSGLRFRLNKSANVVAVPADLTIDAGTQVIVAAHEQIADAATVQLSADAVMTLGDAAAVTETVSVLNGAGAVGLTSLSEIRIGSGSFDGVISGDGSLLKQGVGTLVLSGANTYTGNTSITGGQLGVSGSVASAITVDSGATLSGTGTVTAVQVANGAKVSPGASAGSLSTGHLTLNAASVLDFELDAPGSVGGGVNDLIQVTGDLTLDGVLNVSNLGGLAAGTYTLITYTGTLSNNGLTINTMPTGFVYSLDSSQANAINLVVADPQSVLTLSATELDFGTRSINASATTQTLTVSSTGNTLVNIGAIIVSGDHAAEFSITADTCSSTALVVDGECEVTISQEGDTSGVRTAQLDIPSDAEDNPHVAALRARMVGEPVLDGLDGSSIVFHIGAGALMLDSDQDAVLTMPGALNLDGGTLQVEMISGADADEDLLSFSTTGDVSLDANDAGSDVRVGGIVIGVLVNNIAVGEVLSVTFNADATMARVQTLVRALTYQNMNAVDPANGMREAKLTLSYLGQDVTATVAIDVQPQPVAPPPPSPPPPSVVTGIVSSDIAGDPEKPVIIRDATVTGDVTLTHVVVGSDVVLEPGVTLGEGVIFESPGVMQAIQSMGTFVLDGAIITQLANGQLSIVADGYQALLMPVEIVQATAGQAPGVYFGDNADIYLITDSGLGIRAYALHVDGDSLQSMLSEMTLQQRYTSTGRIVVSPIQNDSAADQITEPAAQQGGSLLAVQSEQVYFSGRTDAVALPANRGDNPGLVEYPVSGLGAVRQLSSLFVAGDTTLLQQDIVPAPVNWPELQEALLGLDGVTAVSMDTRGLIHVTIDGVKMRGVMDYTVIRASEAESGMLSLDMAGDLTGNGMSDYRVTYTNGDRQTLYVFLPLTE